MKNDINKKVAEMCSRFGHKPVYSNIKFVENICLFLSRWKYNLTSGLYFKIKYFFQRHTRGFDDLDKWNAAWYIARKAIPVLTAWRNSKLMGTAIKRHIENRHGEIVELSDDEIYCDSGKAGWEGPNAFSEEEWKAIIDDIIFAFNYVLDGELGCSSFSDTEECRLLYKRYKRGMKLFSLYFLSLWD